MNYLFFDIECANCFQGEGKICSFGYVCVDQNFQILEQRDIVINPKSRFHLKNRRDGARDIELGYTKAEFDKAPDFAHYYAEIAALLTRKNQVVFGHSVINDLNFLMAECRRYRKPYIDLTAYDSQMFYRVVASVNTDIGLKSLCEHYEIETVDIHKSDYDAFLTMRAVEAMCKESKTDIAALLELCVNANYTARDGKIKNNFQTVSYGKKLLDIGKYTKAESALVTAAIENKRFCFSDVFEKQRFKSAVYLTRYICKRGGTVTNKLTKCDYYLDYGVGDRAERLINMRAEGWRVESLDEAALCRYLGVPPAEYAQAETLSLSKLRKI